MAKPSFPFDPERAVSLLMHHLAIEGTTGKEKAIANNVAKTLRGAGVPSKAIRFDTANERIPVPTQTGNLIVTLPGTRTGDRRLFMTHLDTVPLCAGAVPVRTGNRIKSEGATALGGDNRTGVSVLVNMVQTLLEQKLPHPPITLLFTVREESGLFGARHVDVDALGGPTMGFNVDGRDPDELTIGAVGAERFEVEITGKASHAGVHPEHGISATMIASLALAEVHAGGWFGKINQEGREGTSNIGSFGGVDGVSAGNATNVVTDYAHLTGEARSHDSKFATLIAKAYKTAFTNAVGKVLTDKGKKGKVKFSSRMDYYPFRLKENEPVVAQGRRGAESLGMKPDLRIANGGLDANWMVRHGIPTITFGAGQNNIHTIDEYVEIPLYLKGCEMSLSLATLE